MINSYTKSSGQDYLINLASDTYDHQILCGVLASGWIADQEVSGLTVPRYLQPFEQEVFNTLHTSGMGTYHYRWVGSLDEQIIEQEGELHPRGLIGRMLAARSFTRLKTLYESRTQKDYFGPTVLFLRGLQTKALGLAYEHPDEAIGLIDSQHLDPTIEQSLKGSTDWQIYAGAKHKTDYDRVKWRFSHASSELSRLAMNSAFDYRLLRRAVKDPSEYKHAGADIIAEYASTPAARDSLLGYLATYGAASSKNRSVYGAWYQARISDTLIYQLRTKRMFDMYDYYTTRAREQSEAYQRLKEESGRVWARVASNNTLESILQSVQQPFRGMLERTPHAVLLRVIDEVNDVRAAQPGISARGIYLHFYAIAHLTTATPEQKETLVVINQFLNDDFSKTATLPF